VLTKPHIAAEIAKRIEEYLVAVCIGEYSRTAGLTLVWLPR
jgi:hypothetical protein